MSDEVLILEPGAGRAYAIGAMVGVFKADGEESGDRYSVSEWHVTPHSAGPGPHVHDDNEELFLVTEGTMTFVAGEREVTAPRGTFLRIPAGVVHDFRNDGAIPAAAFNVFLPGGFEAGLRTWASARPA